MVARATSLRSRNSPRRVRLPPLIPAVSTTTDSSTTPKSSSGSRKRFSVRKLSVKVMSPTEPLTSDSEAGGNSMLSHRTVFVCGFVSKRWHNSSLYNVVQDLIPNYYVACNGESPSSIQQTRELLSNADSMIFFVNEFTLADKNCLLALQYAWQLMVPIIMLRPPRTKLLVAKRSKRRADIHIGNGSISRIFEGHIDYNDLNTVDFGLVQDLLYEGFKQSVVYDHLHHDKSVAKIQERLDVVFRIAASTPSPFGQHKSSFYLHLAKNPQQNVGVANGNLAVENTSEVIRLTRSMNNLTCESNVKELEKDENSNRTEPTKSSVEEPAKIRRGLINWGQLSSMSRTSSTDRRMSLNHLSLDDLTNFTNTQYLVFPLKDHSKKPLLVRFPEDLLEDQYEDKSVWGSDTSLEEEAMIAPRISTGLSMEEDLSPIASPAPYIGDL